MKVLAVGTGVVAVLLLLVVTISTLVADQNSDKEIQTESHKITKRSNSFRPRIARTDDIQHVAEQRQCKEGSCSVMSDHGSGNENGFDNDDEDNEDQAGSWLPLEMLNWPVEKVTVPINRTKPSLIGDDNTTVVDMYDLDSSMPYYRTSIKCQDVMQLANSNLCVKHPSVLPAIIQGVQLAVNEAIVALKDRRWDAHALKKKQLGNNLLRTATKESAFTHAIISAGITHAVTKACSRHLIAGCGCASNRIPETVSHEDIQWGRCSDDVYFGANISAKVLNAEHNGRDLHTQVNLHNNKAGRLAVISERKVKCKCHGTSGSCAVRTCWMSLNEFHSVGKHITHQYDQAVQVVNNEMKQANMPLMSVSRFTLGRARRTHPDLMDLVYYIKSPAYCEKNKKIGSLGTKGRKCNLDSQGTDSCLHLCCHRGFRVRYQVETYDCECKFTWCCRVECKKCKIKKPYHVCR